MEVIYLGVIRPGSVRLTTLHQVPRLRMSGVLRLLSMYAFVSLLGITLTFNDLALFRCCSSVGLCYLLLAPKRIKLKGNVKLSLCAS